MNIRIDLDRRIVLVDYCGMWLQLSPEAARAMARDLEKAAKKLEYHDYLKVEEKKYEKTVIPKIKITNEEINEKLDDVRQETRKMGYHVAKALEEKQAAEVYNKEFFLRGAPMEISMVGMDKKIEDVEGVAAARDLTKCEVKAMLRYVPDDDLMAPFDE